MRADLRLATGTSYMSYSNGHMQLRIDVTDGEVQGGSERQTTARVCRGPPSLLRHAQRAQAAGEGSESVVPYSVECLFLNYVEHH